MGTGPGGAPEVVVGDVEVALEGGGVGQKVGARLPAGWQRSCQLVAAQVQVGELLQKDQGGADVAVEVVAVHIYVCQVGQISSPSPRVWNHRLELVVCKDHVSLMAQVRAQLHDGIRVPEGRRHIVVMVHSTKQPGTCSILFRRPADVMALKVQLSATLSPGLGKKAGPEEGGFQKRDHRKRCRRQVRK